MSTSAPPKGPIEARPAAQTPPTAVPPANPPLPAAVAPPVKASASPAIWIVALVLGVVGIGAVLGLTLLVGIVGLVMFKARSHRPPQAAEEARSTKSGGPAGYAPSYASPASSYPDPSPGPPPAASRPERLSSIPPNSSTAGDVYQDPPSEPDDRQLNLPEYQREAIRDLNEQRESIRELNSRSSDE